MTEQTLNVPQLLVFIIVSVLAVRWYLAKPSASGAQPTATGRRAGINVTAAQIDQVAQMFPQHDRRQIAWDLQRNGANLAVTTERILSGRALEVPPASFAPPPPQPSPASRPAAPVAKPSQPDLITRYNLASKLSSAADSSTTEPSSQKQKAWSQDRSERQANLQRRREEMILAARRKLQEKEKGSTTGASS